MKVVFKAPVYYPEYAKIVIEYQATGHDYYMEEIDWRIRVRAWAKDNLEFHTIVGTSKCMFGSMDDAILFRLNFS